MSDFPCTEQNNVKQTGNNKGIQVENDYEIFFEVFL